MQNLKTKMFKKNVNLLQENFQKKFIGKINNSIVKIPALKIFTLNKNYNETLC